MVKIIFRQLLRQLHVISIGRKHRPYSYMLHWKSYDPDHLMIYLQEEGEINQESEKPVVPVRQTKKISLNSKFGQFGKDRLTFECDAFFQQNNTSCCTTIQCVVI